jgi:hypothetical protein
MSVAFGRNVGTVVVPLEHRMVTRSPSATGVLAVNENEVTEPTSTFARIVEMVSVGTITTNVNCVDAYEKRTSPDTNIAVHVSEALVNGALQEDVATVAFTGNVKRKESMDPLMGTDDTHVTLTMSGASVMSLSVSVILCMLPVRTLPPLVIPVKTIVGRRVVTFIDGYVEDV